MQRHQLALAALLTSASIAHADLVSITATRDGTLFESSDGGIADGAGQYFFAGETYQTRARRGLVHFDVAGAIPRGVEITAARLTLSSWQGTIGSFEVSIHRALQGWTTGASDAPGNEGIGDAAQAGDATWLHTTADGLGGGTTWNTAGGDFAAQSSASITIGSNGLFTWSSAGLTDDVRLFANDASHNFGWFLIGDESVPGTARRFDSLESAELGGYAPTLEIEFSAVPAPGSIALLGVATILLGRRTRR